MKHIKKRRKEIKILRFDRQPVIRYNTYTRSRILSTLAQIICQIQRDLACPVCAKKYAIGDIQLKGLFDHTLIVQAVCANDHLTILITAINNIRNNDPMSDNDVINMHLFLQNFNGDFQTLWNKLP